MRPSLLQRAACFFLRLLPQNRSSVCDTNFAQQYIFPGLSSHNDDSFAVPEQIPPTQPPSSGSGKWLGWGGGIYNNHWASSDAIVDSSNVGSLALKCQKKYDPGVSAAPLVTEGIAYFPTWSGLLVALDYQKCRVIWETNITELILDYKPMSTEQKQFWFLPVSRTTPVIGGHGDDEVLYVGTIVHALLLAIDKSTGKSIDTIQLETHPFAALTVSPTYYEGHLYIGVSSLEEGAPASIASYECCSFKGSMHAVTFVHGRLRRAWSQAMIPADSKFSGGSVWGSQPSIDPIRNQVFIGTGNFYSVPEEFEACQKQTANITVIKQGLTLEPCLPPKLFEESIIAFDLNSGRINWIRQLGPVDAWNLACVPGALGPALPGSEVECPDPTGVDGDFGMAPTFVLGSEDTPFGLDIIVAGQKNGNLYAINAATGLVLWATWTSPHGLEGGLDWGIAVDDAAVYYTAINTNRINYTLPGGDRKTVISNSAFGAASLKDGHILWQTASPRNTTSIVSPAIVNDVVITGITGNWSAESLAPVGSGSFLALDKNTGSILNEFPLETYFVGAFAVVHDYVMFGTGYAGLAVPTAGSFQAWKLSADG